MKKRLLSLALALVMVFSLLPINAFAIGDTTILSQPTSVTVQAGGTAEFSVSAVNTAHPTATLYYIWYDAEKLTKVIAVGTMDSFLEQFNGAKLGEGRTLTITNAQKDMKIACAVYRQAKIDSITIPADVATSDTVTLTVKTACASHALGNNLFEVPAVEPTCAHEGNIRYYKCNTCGYCYSDANGSNVTTEDACKLAKLTTHKMPLTYHEPTAGTCGNNSIAEYWSCDECGQIFKDEAGTTETTLVNLRLEGKKDADNHPADKVTHKKHTDATCSQKGNFEYWFCEECNTYFKDADLKTKYAKRSDTEIAKDASKHPELVEHAYTAPTCDKEGNLPYYECTACGKYYANADGTGEYSKKSDVTIAALKHNYTWVEFTAGDTVYHAQDCTRCGKRTNVGTHSGGTANCKSPAICSTCGFAYGDIDPNNHANRETLNAVEPSVSAPGYSGDVYCADCGVLLEVGHKTDKLCKHTDPNSGIVVHHAGTEATCPDSKDKHQGNIEYWECSECGKCWTDSALTVEVAKADTVVAYQQHYKKNIYGSDVANTNLQQWGSNVNDHWKECKFCGYVYKDTTSGHSIVEKTLTCHSGYSCRTCGYDDGQRDPYNHDGGTEIRNAKEPVGGNAGYTGDTHCMGCGEKLATGHEYYAPCEGGCKNLIKIPAKEKTCTENGVKAYYECEKCHNYYLNANDTVPTTDDKIVDPCTGHDLHPGLDYLGDISIDKLKKLLGTVNYLKLVQSIKDGNVSVDAIIANIHIKDIDHCHDDQYHWLGCQRCGKTFADLKPEFEEKGIYIKDVWYTLGKKEAHSGGTATCKEKAVCTECGEKYGSLAAHRYGEDNVCTVCGVTIPACDAPVLKITSSNGKAVLSWNAVKGADKYQIERAPDGVNFVKINTGTVKGTTYTDNSAKVDSVYYYRVRAIGTNGSYSKPSNKEHCTIKCAVPSVTAGNNASTGKITLKWSAVSGAAKYEVYRADTKNGTYSLMYTTTGKSYTNTSSNAGYTYYYKVRAISKNGNKSDFCKIVSRTCDCAAPTVKGGNEASTGYVKLSWNKVYGASKYEIWRATSKNGTYTKLYTTSYTSYRNTTSKAGHTYYYKVKAIAERTSYANSAFSSVVSRTCDCARPNVKISLSNGDPRLTWSAVSGADKYIIYRATSKNGTYTKMYTTSNKSYTNTSAKAGKTYYYKVVAVSNMSSYANSAYSSIVSIKAK